MFNVNPVAIVTKVGNHLNKFKFEYQKKKSLKITKNMLLTHTDAFDDYKKTAYKTVLKNAIDLWYTPAYLRNTKTSSLLTLKQFLKLHIKVLDKLYPLQKAISIQPIASSVGLIWNLEYDNKEDIKNNTFALNIVSKLVEARSRKLQVNGLTIEVMEDLKNPFDSNIESEILSTIAESITLDITKFIVLELIQLTAKNTIQVSSHLSDNINKMRNDIGIKTCRGVGNFILTTPYGLEILKDNLDSNMNITYLNVNTDITNIMSLAATINDTTNNELVSNVLVVREDSMPPSIDGETLFLIGYKGLYGEMDAGYVFAPYHLIVGTGLVGVIKLDEDVFYQVASSTSSQLVSSLHTRSATTPMNNNAESYFGLIKYKEVKDETAKII